MMIYAFYNANGKITAAINDSTVKKLPDSAILLTEEQFRDRFNYTVVDGELVYSPEVSDVLPLSIKDYQYAVQNVLDTKSRERNYDGILSLCSYHSSGNATFAAEAASGIEWRDNAWTTCYQMLSDWENELIEQPTVDEVLASIPAMSWPDEV